MHFRLACCFALALSLSAPARAADPAAQARELFQKGSQALAAGKSKDAIDIFEQAYRAGNSPSLLFYLGEAYRQAGNNAKALEEYQLYVEKMPAGPKHAEAEAHIAELKKAPAAAPAKRKLALDDMDLESTAAKAPAKAAAKPKKLELDDVQLEGSAAQAASPAEEKAEKRHHRESKSAAAAEAKNARVLAKIDEEKISPALAAKLADAKVAEEKRAPAPAPKVVEEKVAPAPVAKIGEEKRAPAPAPIVVEEKKSAPPAAPLIAIATPASAPPAPAAAAPVPASPPPAPAPAPAPKLVATTAPAPAARPLAPVLIDRSVPAPSRPTGSGMRTAGLVIGTVGIAALAAGGLFGLGAVNASNDLNAAAQSGAMYDPSLQTRGQRDQTLEIAFLAGGGAALVGGALLYLLAPSSSGSAANSEGHASAVSLGYAVVAPVPGGVSTAAGLRF